MRKKTPSAIFIVAALSIILTPATFAQDEWHFGIGTGFFGLNIDGDEGFTTRLGPVELDASLDSDEVRELLESGFGLGGFAAKGKWMILWSGGQLELRDDLKGTGPGGVRAEAEATFTGSGAEVAATYRFAVTGRHAWSVLGGARYTKHEYDFELEIGPVSLDRNIDQDWTDVIIGFTHGFRFSDKWTWSNRLDAGFGGSEGTYLLKTGLNWQVAKHLALDFYGKGTSIEFENDEKGDPDWYLYDAKEFGLGFNALFTW